jgi:hypothetical protein
MVETPSMLNEKLLLSGVYSTSKVVAPIPLLSIHVANDLEPICRIAWTDCRNNSETRRNMDVKEEDRERLCVRLGREKRMVACLLDFKGV